MTSVAQGNSVTLVAEFYEYSGGPATDVTGLTVAITTSGGSTVLAATSTGVTHAATGIYTYDWTVGAAQTPGDYLAIWSGTDGQGNAVQATELVTVTSLSASGSTGPAPWYATRETVKAALDYKETARNDAQVDRAIDSASRAVEGLLHRRFYPQTATRYFDWPNAQYARPWRLWLDANELISVTTLASGGRTIAPADYFLRRGDDRDEPPYTFIELDLDADAAFGVGPTHQRDIAITGVFGYGADTERAGALAEALDTSETGVDVTDSSVVGVGDLLLVDSERMVVTGKTMADTGVDLATGSDLSASNADVSIIMSTTTGAPVAGESILVDSERMLVMDVAGTTLTVKRAWDGSVLASHAAGASIWAPRTLTVARGALGTTAASHDSGAAVARHVPPGLVSELCVAYALNTLLQRQSGYARVAGVKGGATVDANARDSTGRGIPALEADAVRAYGRKARIRAV